jgi:hypothetical protein
LTPGDPIPAAVLIVRLLERLQVQYLIGGSLASSLYGLPRSTNDVDVVAELQPHHVEALVQALEADFAVSEQAIREAIDRHRSFNAIHVETLEKVDVFVPGNDPWFLAEIARRRPAQLTGADDGRLAFYASPEDVVLSKLRWYQAGGGVSDRQWSDVLAILRVQRGSLDERYLDQWAVTLGLADLFARARREAAG